MTVRRWFAFLVPCMISLCADQAQAQPAPEPLLRLEADGPTAYVTSLAFDPRDGKTLYAAGYDKVIRAWAWDEKTGDWVINRAGAFRVPIGPELQGAINSLVVSPDGAWLAAAGSGVVRGSAGFGQSGMILPGRPPDDKMLLDQGRIYVFNAKRELTVLRGNKGLILSLAFAPPYKGKPAILASTALEVDPADAKKRVGVIRVWNVETGKELDWGGDQPTRWIFPGLAVWHTGPNPKDVRVAYAWGDGKLRAWDLGNGFFDPPDGLDDSAWDSADQLNQNNTLIKVPGKDRIFTGSYDGKQGRIREWDATSGRSPKADNQALVQFPQGKKGRYLPRALALVLHKGDTYAAVVLRRDPPKDDPTDKKESYELRLIRSNGVEAAKAALWTGGESMPSLAASPQGDYVAVAGNKDHTIHLYRVADLLAGKTNPQILRGVGEELPGAGLLRRGNGQYGILLRQKADPNPDGRALEPKDDDLVFDINARTLLTYKEQLERTKNAKFLMPRPDAWSMAVAAASLGELDWKPDAPKLGDWRTALVDQKKGQAVVISNGDKEIGRVELAEGQRVTAIALRPPLDPLKNPVLAVAFTERGLPRLRLYVYNGQTFEWFRQCSGHTDPIHALAISSDGRLLVSAGDDQTVCVWSLTNLDKIIGVHGQLTGVAVKGDGNDPVEVFNIEADSPATGKLKVKEDVIEALTVDKKKTNIASAREFYDALFMMKPGATVTVHLKGNRNVDLKVGQGIDERKPLFSLFVTRVKKTAPWEWVGWNPSGYYESSSPAVEDYIGFQVNSADAPEKASTFAPAPEYRKKLYKEGILRHLVGRGNLSAALKDWDEEDKAKPRPQPKMALYIDERGQDPANLDVRGQVLVRGAPVTLMVHVSDAEPDRLQFVRFQVGQAGDAPGAMKDMEFRPAKGEWAADLADVVKTPGVYRVRVALRTRDVSAVTWEEELLVRYQPPAPKIDRSADWLKSLKPPEETNSVIRIITRDETLALQGKIETTGAKEEKVKIELRQGDETEQIKDGRLDRKIKLQKGDQWIEVRAINTDALAGYEEFETDRITLNVTYQPKDAEELKAAPELLLDRKEASLVWREPTIQITGMITSKDGNDLHEAKLGDRDLKGFKADTAKSFKFDEEVKLEQPGLQKLVFKARTKESQTSYAVVAIDYHPNLSLVTLVKPATGLIVYEEGKAAPRQEFEGLLSPPNGPNACEAILLVNGKQFGDPIPVPAKAETIRGTFQLEPGLNRVQVRIRMGKALGDLSEAVQVSYLQPPRVEQFEDAVKWKAPTEKAVVALAVRVHSALEVKKGNIEATVNGRDITEVAVDKDKADEQTWLVRMPSVALNKGPNEVRVWASNADGRSREPGVLTLVYKLPPKPPAPPVVEFLSPARDVTVTEPEIELRARITSTAPLKRVALSRRGKGPAEVLEINMGDKKPDPKGVYEVTEKIKDLATGENNLLLEAQNESGSDEASAVVTYLKKPVRLEIQYLQPKGTDDRIAPERQLNGSLHFKKLPQDLCVLHGVVTWDENDEDLLKEVRKVRGYVNGKRQPMTQLFKAKGGARQREFELTLQFTQLQDNIVEIELPDLAQEASNPVEFLVDCAKPNAKQFGHLLVIGAGKTESKEELIKRALGSIQGTATEGGKGFTAESFAAGGQIYGPLTGSTVTPGRVLSQLRAIYSQIDRRSSIGAANDVVMIYYEGNEAVTSDGHFLCTDRSHYDSDPKTSALTLDSLEAFCGEIMGAQVLLLDVARDKSLRAAASDDDKDTVIKRPRHTHVSVFRSMCWLDHPDAPTDPQLLAQWEEATKAHAKLFEVGDEVRKKIKPTIYAMEIPISLRDLLVGNTSRP
jgi:WD40 repeat protein